MRQDRRWEGEKSRIRCQRDERKGAVYGLVSPSKDFGFYFKPLRGDLT